MARAAPSGAPSSGRRVFRRSWPNCLANAIFWLLLLPWHALAQSAQVPVAWRDAAGVVHIGRAGVTEVIAYEERRDDRHDRFCTTMAEDLENRSAEELNRVFDGVRRRAPAFADWVFGWETSSYRYLETIRGLIFSFAENLAQFRLYVDLNEQHRRVETQITDTFNEIALQPDRTQPALRAAQAQLETEASTALQRLSADEWRQLEAFVTQHVHPTLAPPDPASRQVQPLLLHAPLDATAAPFAFPRPLAGIDGPLGVGPELATSMLIRTPRPIIARILGAIVRVAAGLSVWRVASSVAETTELGLIGYGPGLLAGMAIAISTAWALDFAITTADEYLHREQYEERLRVLIARLQSDLGQAWRADIRATVLPACLGPLAVAGGATQ